ncbi:hypothetical protein GOV09_04070 [Candidatus Woesearchaeota archaeon]|nr:hypothetical protein [Candidatus Woesearchaeota archaeon]
MDYRKYKAEQEKKKKVHEKHHKVALVAVTIAAILVVSVISNFFGSETTGYVSLTRDKVELNELAYTDSEFLLSADAPLTMSSARISGKILGSGSVKVYLVNDEEKKLVYTNEIRPKHIPLITGFAVKSEYLDYVPESRLRVNLDNLQIIGKGNTLTGILLQSEGNPQGMYVEDARLSWTPDNGEHIEGITINDVEFWGYGKAGFPVEKQPSGSALNGWGQKLPENTPRRISSIDFDAPIQDKEITIEIMFHDYLPGFRLADERSVKIYIDLSGSKESYVEEDGQRIQTFDLVKIELPEVNFTTPDPIDETEWTVNPLYPGFEATDDVDGRIRKRKVLGTIAFASTPDAIISFQVIENPLARDIFEQTPIDTITEILSECEETCVLDPLLLDEYEFEFEIEEGTAINVSTIEFS